MTRDQFKQLDSDSLYYSDSRYKNLVKLVHEFFDQEEAELGKEQAKEEHEKA